MKIGSGPSVSAAELYKKKVVAILRRQMAMSSSFTVLFSSKGFSKGTGHSARTLPGQNPQRKVGERVTASRASEVRWNSETDQLPRSFAESIQIYIDKTATSWKFNVLLAYAVHFVQSRDTERRKRCLFDHGYTLLRRLPVGIAELGVTDGDTEVDESVSLPGLAWSNLVPLDEFIPKKSVTDE